MGVYPDGMSGSEDTVAVVGWNPQWPAIARAETSKLIEVATAVEHVGSTAVPGMPSRAVVDLLVGLEGFRDSADDVAAAIVEMGFERVSGTVREGRIWLRRLGEPRVYVNVVEFGGTSWKDTLALREYLRKHPDEASAYARVKRRAAEGGPDVITYSQRKRETVEKLTDRARGWKLSHPRG